MTPETSASLRTAAFVTLPVVVVAILAIAYVERVRPGPRVLPTACTDLSSHIWALELDGAAGTPTTRPYILGTIDLSSRGGLKHNIEVNWKTPNPGSFATEKKSEYDFDPGSDCSASGTTLTLTFRPDNDSDGNPYPPLSVTLGSGGVSGNGGNPVSSWPTGSFVQVQ